MYGLKAEKPEDIKRKYKIKVAPYRELDANFFKVCRGIFILKDSKAIHLYLYLCNKYDKEIITETYERMSKATGMNRNTISEKIKVLSELGFIDVVKVSNGITICNGYVLKYPKNIDGELIEEVNHNYYVYMHVYNNEVLYVGKGKKNRYRNLSDRNKEYLKFIKEIGKENIETYIIAEVENELLAYEIEKDYISDFKKIGQCRFNIVCGHPTLHGQL